MDRVAADAPSLRERDREREIQTDKKLHSLARLKEAFEVFVTSWRYMKHLLFLSPSRSNALQDCRKYA